MTQDQKPGENTDPELGNTREKNEENQKQADEDKQRLTPKQPKSEDKQKTPRTPKQEENKQQ